MLRLEVTKTGQPERKRPPIDADLILTATGRGAVTDGLGLAESGVELASNGDILVSPELMSTAGLEPLYSSGGASACGRTRDRRRERGITVHGSDAHRQ